VRAMTPRDASATDDYDVVVVFVVGRSRRFRSFFLFFPRETWAFRFRSLGGTTGLVSLAGEGLAVVVVVRGGEREGKAAAMF
jgi:hypothetical protein